MRVRIDETGEQGVLRALVSDTRRVTPLGIAHGKHVEDPSGIDGECETFLCDDLGLDA
jgi:hypothetical protein